MSTVATTALAWQHRAACRDTDPELFFPVGPHPPLRQVERAKRMCAGCPVRQACLDDSLSGGMDHGIWGGLTDRERRELGRISLAVGA